MPTGDTKVVALAQKIALMMQDHADRSGALDAYDMARIFYRRLSTPSRPRISEARQSKTRSSPKSL
jgi:hypothetical protein